MTDEHATIDMALDAFIFNEEVCSGPNCRIAPLAQPNYSYLSYDKALVRDDVMEPVELQYALPAKRNDRFMDLGRNEPRTSRLGVYLHWVLPNVYRTGSAKATESRADEHPAPTFMKVPNRWLVIRQIKEGTQEPKDARLEEFQGWVVESDRQLEVDELGYGVDTQVDVSPYVSTKDTEHQGRYFIGMKTPVGTWAENETADRVHLTVLSSSNQLFADYQPQNGNVFSIRDNFAYGTDGKQQLAAAEANYFVLGWHHDRKDDPLHALSGASFQEQLTRLGVRMRHNFSRALLAAAADEVGGTLCCGYIHSVKWNRAEKPATVPAEDAAREFFKTATPPVAIGTGPLDALLAYINSHTDHGEIEELLIKIQTLLLRQDDGVDAQLEAEDMLINRDFSRAEGGMHWYLAGDMDSSSDSRTPLQPTDEQLNDLATLNAVQEKLDALKRLLPQARWDLFAEWWKYVCDRGAKEDKSLVKIRVTGLTETLKALVDPSETAEDSIMGFLPREVGDLLQKFVLEPGEEPSVKPGASARFHMQQDPTMLIAGLKSGWPSNHTERSEVTMTSHIRPTTRAALPNVLTTMIAKLPAEYKATATALLENFLGVSRSPEAAVRAYAASGKDAATIKPNIWDKQPWSPLFLEWEGEYFHIPFTEFWKLEEHKRGKQGKLLRYGITDGLNLASEEAQKHIHDKRTLSGRILLLPQPSFSLSAKVNQLFDSLTEEELLEHGITKEVREKLKEGLKDFPYMSASLSGFTNHLLTLLEGTHIKPNVRDPVSNELEPIPEAIAVGESDISIGKDELKLVDQETGVTPYGTHVDGLGKSPAFKAVAHGQFRFTKINIIDKFGQAISAIDPTPRKEGPPAIFPCISDFFACQMLDEKKKIANTVIRSKPGENQFIQLPPRLNQPARLNSAFMMGSEAEGWRPATEWENPVLGWMVVNHADYGLQVFLPDGRFYREVRLGGKSGQAVSDPWLPFAPPDDGIPETEALDRLLKELGETPDYLKSFFDMVQQAFANIHEAPHSYAEFLPAIIGKPIALVNIGWSLELAALPLKNQSFFNTAEVTETLYSYDFPLKMGDRNRFYDGLVGYYTPRHEEKIYTHFPAGGPTTTIDTSNYPTLKPFHVDPRGKDPAAFVKARNEKWTGHVFTAIVDPFLAVHGYTGILPIDDTLRLPTWTVELALNHMTAFFHLGPLLLSRNVASFEEKYELTSDYDLEKPLQSEYPGDGVTLPSLNITEWNWLQPYYIKDTEDAEFRTKFMGLKLDRMPEKPVPIEEQMAPYTAVEGYLQLKKAIGKKFHEEDSE